MHIAISLYSSYLTVEFHCMLEDYAGPIPIPFANTCQNVSTIFVATRPFKVVIPAAVLFEPNRQIILLNLLVSVVVEPSSVTSRYRFSIAVYPICGFGSVFKSETQLWHFKAVFVARCPDTLDSLISSAVSKISKIAAYPTFEYPGRLLRSRTLVIALGLGRRLVGSLIVNIGIMQILREELFRIFLIFHLLLAMCIIIPRYVAFGRTGNLNFHEAVHRWAFVHKNITAMIVLRTCWRRLCSCKVPMMTLQLSYLHGESRPGAIADERPGRTGTEFSLTLQFSYLHAEKNRSRAIADGRRELNSTPRYHTDTATRYHQVLGTTGQQPHVERQSLYSWIPGV